MKARFAFFDLDGTLADTDRDIRRAWKAAMADLGLECPRFDELFIAGPPIEEMARTLFPGRCTQGLVDDLRRAYASHYDNDDFPETREYPGVLDDVKRIKAGGVTVAIVTNKRHAGAIAMSRHFGWDRVFDGVFSGDMFISPDARARFAAAGVEVPAAKLRKPELLALVMRFFGASPSESVLVGDTKNDFEAASANGVFSVGVGWGYGTEAELSMAGAVCRSLPFPL